MGCTHEMRSGGVVTVINAGGPPNCSFCREDELRADNARLRMAIVFVMWGRRTDFADTYCYTCDRETRECVACHACEGCTGHQLDCVLAEALRTNDPMPPKGSE